MGALPVSQASAEAGGNFSEVSALRIPGHCQAPASSRTRAFGKRPSSFHSDFSISLSLFLLLFYSFVLSFSLPFSFPPLPPPPSLLAFIKLQLYSVQHARHQHCYQRLFNQTPPSLLEDWTHTQTDSRSRPSQRGRRSASLRGAREGLQWGRHHGELPFSPQLKPGLSQSTRCRGECFPSPPRSWQLACGK